jgi:hypothetical protein
MQIISTLPVSGDPQETTAGVTKTPVLWVVRSTGMRLMEAPSSAYHRGRLALG